MTNKQIILGLIGFLVVLLLCVGATLAGWSTFYTWQGGVSNPINTVSQTTPEPSPTPQPQPTVADSPAEAADPTPVAKDEALARHGELSSTAVTLLETILPIRDQRVLAMRLKRHGEAIPLVVRESPPYYALNDSAVFWVTDNYQTPPRQFEVTARLAYLTAHSAWWVEEGFTVEPDALERSAERFETETYPINREFFGSEWSPGIDNDLRVHIFMGNVPGVAGYYAAANSYSKLAEPYSNEREMFFINLRAIRPGSTAFDGVLAHEFQHMIHWHQDRNEDTWVNEGLSELATYLNGFGPSNFLGSYIANPDTQLTSWSSSPGANPADYGAGFLFAAYFLEQYGEEMMQAVVAHQQNGIAGFDAVLFENGYEARFDDVFADFVVANYVTDVTVGEGAWGYHDVPMRPMHRVATHESFPVIEQATVQQHATDYIGLTNAAQPLTFHFTGSITVPIVANQAHSGAYKWYSHRGDDSNTRLTRAFDLSEVEQATLNYWTWYDIEESWDFAYVEVSVDRGQTWILLQTEQMTLDNPTGNAYGPGYTGQSNGWIEQTIDLSPVAGQEVLVRFEYVTDDALNNPGWTIDDISIPEIGFFDDVEAGPGAWQAEGFVRIEDALPQRFLVQLIEIGETVTVRHLPLDEVNTGKITVEGLGSTVEEAVIAISGLTPITTEAAPYQYRITQ